MISNTTASADLTRDRVRQILNLILSISPIVATLIGYLTGLNSRFDSSTSATPQVVPADYAFSIWALIYAGSLAYGIYQALPQHREDELLRRIGFYSASAFLATTVWLVFAQTGIDILTVFCLFWILFSLVGALIQFIDYHHRLNRTERLIVVLPLSIFAGWATVAAIANTATVLKDTGVSNFLFPNAIWSIIMLVIGGLIASFVTYRDYGNIGYALTVIWALIGVIVANIVRTPSLPVASTAGIMALIIAVTLVIARWQQSRVALAKSSS